MEVRRLSKESWEGDPVPEETVFEQSLEGWGRGQRKDTAQGETGRSYLTNKTFFLE